MNTFIEFKQYALSHFSKSKHPDELLKNKAFIAEFKKWYMKIFAILPEYRTCGVCLYEKFREMADLTDQQIENRLNLTHLIKENTVIWHEGRPYGRKSQHITPEIMAIIAEKHPKKVEKNPNFKPVKVEKEPETIEKTEKPAPKPRKPRKKKVADGDNS